MKKKWISVIGIAIIITIFTTVSFANNPIGLIVNGQKIKPDIPPQLINGRTMVPVRWVGEAFGAQVEWDGVNRQIRINGNSTGNESSSEESSIFLPDLKIENWGDYDSLSAEVALPENISKLSKEEKAKILEKLLAHSYSEIKYAVTKTGDWGDVELWLNARHHFLHEDYVKFITLFSQELLGDQSSPVLEDIDTAYSNVLQTYEAPERPYWGVGGFAGAMSKTDYNRILVLNKFGYYLSFGATYYDIPGVPAPQKYQDPASDFTVYDIPSFSDSGNIIWGEGRNPSQLDDQRIAARKRLFELVTPYGGTITEGFIQTDLVQKLGISRNEVDYLIDLYQNYRLRGNVPQPVQK